ncbi:GNAT family N-acetyltransferase [Actinomadura hibisca]|uniref:GNAT family N-acetyltransferase n=1 Tax=Actinomadura hibisca TaxID=68565 RepID=UPI0008342C14|nr:GNAT family N-acetyltransferase [Actinomadura hibisca]
MPNIDFQNLDGHQALDVLDDLADLYVQVYAEPPYNSAPKFSRDRFVERTREQAMASGFALVTGRCDGELLGFTFGFSMMPGAWWANASPPSAEVLEASKFALVEFVVAKAWRGQGIGRRLLSALLKGRAEEYATLAAVIDADAYGLYLRWGWQKVAEFRVEPPHSDALVLPLHPVAQARDA